MVYENIREAVFLKRLNRFMADIEISGVLYKCHVKNTGRCSELLLPGSKIFVQDFGETFSKRETRFDLISVYKGTHLVNIDSISPNKAFGEWLKKGGLVSEGEFLAFVRPECTFGNSRFDFYAEIASCSESARKLFIEVKGVTLEENGVALFPDAPTERGIKHINELIDCVQKGYEAFIVFVIQMDDINLFSPNYKTHAAFGEALCKASKSGVNIIGFNCNVSPCELSIKDRIQIRL